MSDSIRVLSLHTNPARAEQVGSSLLKQDQFIFEIDVVDTSQKAFARLDKGMADVVLIDSRFPGLSQVKLVEKLCQQYPSIPFVLLADSDSELLVIDIIQKGDRIYPVKGPVEGITLGSLLLSAIEKEKRLEAEEALRQVKSRYETLAESSAVGIWHITVKGETIYMNPAMKGMLNIENLEDIKGKLFRSFFTQESIKRMRGEQDKREKGISSVYEVELIGDDGRLQNMMITGAPLFSVEGQLESLICTFIDITETKRTANELKYRAGLKKLIATISAQFINLGCDEVAKGLDDALERVAKFTGLDRASMFFEEEEKNRLKLAQEWIKDGSGDGKSLAERIDLNELNWLQERAMNSGPFFLGDVRDLPEEAGPEKEILKARGVVSFVCVPLLYAGQRVGLLTFDSHQRVEELTQDVLHLFQILGEIFVSAIQRRKSEAQLQKLSLAVEQSTSIIMITDAKGSIEYVNAKFTEVTGYSLEEVVGKNPRFLKSEKIPSEEFRPLWEALTAGNEWTGDFLNKKKNGEIYWERATISPIKNALGVTTHFLAVKEDITNRRRAEETIQHMAYYDPLTDLPNKVLFNDRLTQALAQARHKNQLVAIMLLDLDRFKNINDTLGHTMGDLLLQEVARRLGAGMREGDTLARLGGDEFMILLIGVQQVEAAVQLAQEKLMALKPAFSLEGQEVHITPSIGISVFPYDGEDAVTLLKNADTALNRAKDQGRSTYQLYTPAMNAKAFERMTLENSLRKALEKDEFTLYYQPQLNLNTGEIVAMEALIRWVHPDMGLVSPTQFIPLAEETGLIIPIGEWVLRNACEQNKKWQDAGYAPLRIAVNLSARQFRQQNIVELIASSLKASGLEPHWLDLEITESTLMYGIDTTIATLRSLSRLGIQISIDDFGTGYSSLSYLKKFPINTLKIDRSFIREINVDPDDAAITSAVIAMAHRLKLRVTAEGVETMEQLELLRTMNCDQMQGFLFSKPVPAKTVTSLLMEKLQLKLNKRNAS